MIAENDEGYQLRADGIDAELVHRWISTDTYWAAGRDVDRMSRALANSLTFGVFEPGGAQVAVARAVTDHATFAWICDVYVDPAHRGRGLGTWMVGELTRELFDRGVGRVLLATRDAHEVYRRVGFQAVDDPERWMIARP